MDTDELFATAQKWNPFVQAVSCLQTYFLSATIGAVSGLSAVGIPQIQQETEFLSDGSDDEHLSWFASLPFLSLGIFSAVGGPLGQWLGRKRAMSVVTPLFLIAFALQGLAPTMYVLLIGRILVGVASGLVCGPSAAFVSEISDARWRTTLNSITGASYLLGLVVIYSLGAVLPWRTIVWTSIAFPVLAFMCSFVSHESPSWLVSKGKIDEAVVVLSKLQGWNGDASKIEKGLQDIINTEILIIQKSLKSKDSSTDGSTRWWQKVLALATRADIRKPFLISLIMCALQQLSGVPAISYYAVSILVQSRSTVNEYLGTILFGLARLISMILSSFLLYRFRRKNLYVFSSILATIGMLALSVWNFIAASPSSMAPLSTTTEATVLENSSLESKLNDTLGEQNSETSTINYLIGMIPLAATLLAVFGYQIGLSPISWSYAAELFPLEVRSEMSGIVQAISSFFIFLSVKTFPLLSSDECLGLGGVMAIQACILALAALYGMFFMPETKDKRLEQVNSSFKNGRKENPAKEDRPETETAKDVPATSTL